MSEQKKVYLYMIEKAAKECNDISTLDLVWKILVKMNESNENGGKMRNEYI